MSLLYVCMSVTLALWLDLSGDTLAGPIRRHSGSTNQEALWLDQSEGTLAQPIRRHSGSRGSTNQEALWLDPLSRLDLATKAPSK